MPRAPHDPAKRYELASKLTAQADHLLLLTATPHHGKEAAAIRGEVFRMGASCPWALRRLKEDLKDLDGRRLFPDRHAIAVRFSLNSEEYHLYKSVTAYINQFIPQQTGRRRFRKWRPDH